MSSLPPAAGPVTVQLVCRARSGATQTFTLKGEQTLMGRDPGLGVSVTMEGISRRHAKISFDGKNYWIEDLRSTNGTFLNGAPVQKDRLRHLDVITLGKKLDLLFVLRTTDERQVVKRQGIVRAALIPADAPDAPHEVGVGEITLGRSAACNVQAESGTISKVHAQIRRTLDQLVVQDLGSSNGTFVNGARVTVAELRQGDELSLAGVALFRVVVEIGEVTTTSGSYAAQAPGAVQAPERPRFSNAWKTRFEWDSEELKQIGEAQQAGVARAERTIMPSVKPQPKPTQVKKPAAAAPASPAGQPPAPAPPAAVAKPAVSAPAPKLPVPAPPKPTTTPAKPQPSAAVPAPTPSSPAAKPPAPPPPRLEPSPSPAPARTPRIVEVRLSGGGYDVVANATGAHSLGRAKDANLRLDNPTVSRKHARIIVSDDRSTAYLQDMGGANGTLLNGVELRELKPLKEGDRIRVGEIELTVSLKKV